MLFYIYVLCNSFERLKELIKELTVFFYLKHLCHYTHELTLLKSKALFITFCILLIRSKLQF